MTDELERKPFRIVRGGRNAGIRSVLDHGADPVWMGRREHRRGRASFGDAEQHDSFQAHRVENCQRVVDDVLQRVRTLAVRQSRAAFVERHYARERAHPIPKALLERVRHADLQVADEPPDEQHVDRSRPAHRVSDRNVAVSGVAHRCPARHFPSVSMVGLAGKNPGAARAQQSGASSIEARTFMSPIGACPSPTVTSGELPWTETSFGSA